MDSSVIIHGYCWRVGRAQLGTSTITIALAQFSMRTGREISWSNDHSLLVKTVTFGYLSARS